MKIHEQTLGRIVGALSKACSPQTIAAVIDNTVCADAQPSLTDDEVRLVELIHDELVRRNPEAVVIAQNL